MCVEWTEPTSLHTYEVGNSPGQTLFAIEPMTIEDSMAARFDDSSLSRSNFNITTKFKNDTACKGVAYTETCVLHQGLAEYSIILQNNTISLQYPHWQNDSFLQDLSPYLMTSASSWNRAFINLYNPVRNTYSRSKCDSNTVVGSVYTNCPREAEWDKGNMSCRYDTINSAITVRDSMDFKIENGGKDCGQTWRNPMQVCENIHSLFPFLLHILSCS